MLEGKTAKWKVASTAKNKVTLLNNVPKEEVIANQIEENLQEIKEPI